MRRYSKTFWLAVISILLALPAAVYTGSKIFSGIISGVIDCFPRRRWRCVELPQADFSEHSGDFFYYLFGWSIWLFVFLLVLAVGIDGIRQSFRGK